MFALLIAGRPLDTNFQPIDATKLMTLIPRPSQVHEFSLALLQPSLPPLHAVGVYFSVPGLPAPFSEWQYVGMLSMEHPTATFRSPWHGKVPEDTPVVHLGLSVESVTRLAQMAPADAKEAELALESAAGIAQDLHRFMASFAQSTGKFGLKDDMLTLPTDCVDRWYRKFVEKHKKEPFFWMRKDLTART